MPEKTPADRGRRLIDALIIWITPSPPSPASTVSRSESPEAGDTWLEPSAVVKIAPTDRRRGRAGNVAAAHDRVAPGIEPREQVGDAGGCDRWGSITHDPVEPVACDTLEGATVQIGPGPSAHLDVHGQGTSEPRRDDGGVFVRIVVDEQQLARDGAANHGAGHPLGQAARGSGPLSASAP